MDTTTATVDQPPGDYPTAPRTPKKIKSAKMPPSTLQTAIETGFRLARAESTLGFLRYYADNFANPPEPDSSLTQSQKAKKQAWREVQQIIALAREEKPT